MPVFIGGSSLRFELRQAARRLLQSPGFAAAAIGTLAIGIGVNTAMFSLMDGLLFRPPFHIAQPEQVVRVLFRSDDSPDASVRERSDYPTYAAVKASDAFAGSAAYTNASVSIGRGVDASLGSAMLVTHEFFRLLGTQPHRGTFFESDATAPDGGSRVVVSYGFWQRRFGGDVRAIGAQLLIDGRVYFISGVAPKGFASLHTRPLDLWLPIDHASATSFPRDWRENRGSYWLAVVARLKAGSGAAAAEQRASAALRHRRAALEETRAAAGITLASVVPGRGADKPREVKVSLWLTGVTAFVLLIACANVANLILARNFARRREYAIRLSLGATRWQLMRQLLADICVIAVPGTFVALLVGFLIRNVMPAFLSGEIPLSRDLFDPRTTGIMIGSALLAFALVSTISLTQIRTTSLTSALTVSASDAKYSGKRTRGALLAVQAGLCLALLCCAGLFAKSLRRVQSLDLGLELDRTIQVSINLDRSARSSIEVRALYERALERVRAHEGVERAAIAQGSPYMSGTGVSPWTAERGHEELWSGREVAYNSAVGAGFFSTVGALSLRGRDFTDDDRVGAPAVAIINAPLARHLWPSKDAIGECMFLDDSPTCFRVVGVLGGVWKFRALERNKMAVYLPLAQGPDPRPGSLFIRPRGDARAFLVQARSLVQSIHPDLPAVRVVLTRDIVDPEFKPWRLGATMFSVFGTIALLIAAIGLYGVVALSTALRLKEIGVRMALGARWPHIVRVVVGEGIAAVGVGLLVGAVLVLVASRWMGGVLFETSPRDPAILVQTALILLAVSAVAVTVPIVKTLRMSPARVLRST